MTAPRSGSHGRSAARTAEPTYGRRAVPKTDGRVQPAQQRQALPPVRGSLSRAQVRAGLRWRMKIVPAPFRALCLWNRRTAEPYGRRRALWETLTPRPLNRTSPLSTASFIWCGKIFGRLNRICTTRRAAEDSPPDSPSVANARRPLAFYRRQGRQASRRLGRAAGRRRSRHLRGSRRFKHARMDSPLCLDKHRLAVGAPNRLRLGRRRHRRLAGRQKRPV